MNRHRQQGDEDERIKSAGKSICMRALVGTATYPLTYAKTLFQLGYEPYPMRSGKKFVIAGKEAYYLPNALSYIRNVYNERGAGTLYNGLGAAVSATTIGGLTSFGVSWYLDRYYPNVGGEPLEEDKEERKMTAHESFRMRLRDAIRDSIAHTVAVIASRPFTVIMVRQIAQHVGGEDKYGASGLLSSIFTIGNEEGLRGFFSGLVPALVSEFIIIWGCAAIRYAIGRCLNTLTEDDQQQREPAAAEEDDERRKNINFIVDYAVPFLVSGVAYPFNVVSTVMGVDGSGLAVSLLPYSTNFTHWNDAYSFLKPHGLTRGNRLFFREHKGAISPSGGIVYASN